MVTVAVYFIILYIFFSLICFLSPSDFSLPLNQIELISYPPLSNHWRNKTTHHYLTTSATTPPTTATYHSRIFATTQKTHFTSTQLHLEPFHLNPKNPCLDHGWDQAIKAINPKNLWFYVLADQIKREKSRGLGWVRSRKKLKDHDGFDGGSNWEREDNDGDGKE